MADVAVGDHRAVMPSVRADELVSRPRRWWLLAVVVLLVGFVGSMVAYAYTSRDHLGVFDDAQVIDTAEAACKRMDEAVRAHPGSMQEQNQAVVEMVRTVRGLGPGRLENDHPAEQWLTDWERLVKARETDRPFVVPTEDGKPITDRMNDVGLECQVPHQLLR